MAAQLDLPDIEKGATYRHVLLWTSKSKVAINLSGVTARMHVRETVASPLVLLELTTENGRIQIAPTLGKISLYVSSDDTTALRGSGGVYDLELTMSNADIIRLVEGSVTFAPEVTR